MAKSQLEIVLIDEAAAAGVSETPGDVPVETRDGPEADPVRGPPVRPSNEQKSKPSEKGKLEENDRQENTEQLDALHRISDNTQEMLHVKSLVSQVTRAVDLFRDFILLFGGLSGSMQLFFGRRETPVSDGPRSEIETESVTSNSPVAKPESTDSEIEDAEWEPAGSIGNEPSAPAHDTGPIADDDTIEIPRPEPVGPKPVEPIAPAAAGPAAEAAGTGMIVAESVGTGIATTEAAAGALALPAAETGMTVAAGAGLAAAATNPITIALAALAAGAIVAGVAVKKASDLFHAAAGTIEEFSADVALAQAENERRNTLAMIRRSERIGPDLADAEKLRGRVSEKLSDLGTEILGVLLSIMRPLEPAIEKGLSLLDVAVAFLGLTKEQIDVIVTILSNPLDLESIRKEIADLPEAHRKVAKEVTELFLGESEDELSANPLLDMVLAGAGLPPRPKRGGGGA